MDKMNFFIPITKVNAERREVWGWGAIEEPDNSDEILDYASSKPHFMEWSNRAQKRSGGKSLGNVRAMHRSVAAGKLIDLRADDTSKGFWVGAKIVDDREWKKVEEGVYTGFSVGGSYEKRWSDFQNPGKIRYTAKPTELSIVDSPCIPSATFEMVKSDGITEEVEFRAGNGENSIEVDFDEEKDEIGDVMNKINNIRALLGRVEEELEQELEKADVPGSPEPVADIPLKGEFVSETVEQMPPPSVLMEIKPNAEPSQEVLATHAVNTEDLTSAMDAWLPKVGALVKDIVTGAIDEMVKNKVMDTDSAPEQQKILVKKNGRNIKIFRKE